MDPLSSPPRVLNAENYQNNSNYGNRRVFNSNKSGFGRNDRPDGRIEKPRHQRWDQTGENRGPNYARRPPLKPAVENNELKPTFKTYNKPNYNNNGISGNNGYQKPFNKPFNKPYQSRPFPINNKPPISPPGDVPCSFWLHELSGGYAEFREIREASCLKSSKHIIGALCDQEHAVILFWDSKEAYFYGAAVVDKSLLKENPHEFFLLWIYLTDISCSRFFSDVNFESFLKSGVVPAGLGTELLKQMAVNETQLHDLKRIPLKPFEIKNNNSASDCFDDFLTDYT